jgi:hypothetical protein
MKMKITISKILTVFVFSVIISCNKKEENNTVKKDEIPEALKEDNSSLKRYSRKNGDLINELYSDLVEKSEELQNLENEIEKFNPNETIYEFNNYNIKSRDYYSSSKSLANRINDSILKNRILALLKKSNNQYLSKENEFDTIISKVIDREKSIEDYHNVLKVVLTLPILEKYQNENMPNKQKLEKIIQKEDSIIEATKKLTPKY